MAINKSMVILATLLLCSSCSLLDTSFYDDNESMLAVEVRHSVADLDCEHIYTLGIQQSVQKLYLYTESKKSKDIQQLVSLMKETSDGLHEKESMSKTYCELKKKLLEKQSSDIANAIMRRY